MTTLKIGIIGTGVMGADHARILADGVSGGVLAAVRDTDAQRARTVAGQCGARVFADAASLISAPDIDAVLVCSPDATHAPLTLACIAAGKPVLVEKPLATSPADARAIIAAELSAGRRLVQVGFMRRFDPGYRAMKQELEAGGLGQALFLHCVHRNAVAPDYLTSDSIISNSAVHEFDIARFLLAEELVSATVITPRPSRLAPNRTPQFIVLESQSGIVVDIEAFVDAGYGYDVRAELVCEKGSVSLNPSPGISVRRDGHDGFGLAPDWRLRFRDAYRDQMKEWIQSIHTGVPAGASAWDGYRAMMTAQACLSAWSSRARMAIGAEDCPALYVAA